MIKELKTAECYEVNGAHGELTNLITTGVFLVTLFRVGLPDIWIQSSLVTGGVADRGWDVYKPVLRSSIKACAMALGFAEIAGMIVGALER